MSVLRNATYSAALTLKTVLIDGSTGSPRWWNTSGTPAFEAYNASHIANYGITVTQNAGCNYTWIIPSTLPASTSGCPYRSITFACAGASLATGDITTGVVYEDSFSWSGTYVYTEQNSGGIVVTPAGQIVVTPAT